MELETELRDRDQELEKLKEVDRERFREVHELKSSNVELRSIIRHALEDMKREHIRMTNALQDRIKRHAPCALRSYCAQTEPRVPSTRCSQDPPYAIDSVSHAPAGTVHKHINIFNAMSSNVPRVDRWDCSPTDTSSLLGPATKRRRWEVPTFDECWDQPNSRTHLPAPEHSGSIYRGNFAASAGPAAGTSASKTTSDQNVVTSALAGIPSYLSPQCGSMPSQQYDQQPSIESYDDIIRSFNNPVIRLNAQSDSPVQFESLPQYNIANSPLP